MLSYGDSHNIALAVFSNLGIPEDAYKTWSKEEIDLLNKKYLNNEDYIRGLILDELSNYDTSENVQSDINEIVEDAISDVFFMIDDIVENWYRYQNSITLNVYNEIIQAMNNIVGVEDVDVAYDPADPDVGIYNEERSIEVKLTNGASIYFTVEMNAL